MKEKQPIRTGVRIRRARPRDSLAVAALDRVAWRDNAHSAFVPDGEHVWRIWCEHALTFVACRGTRVVGAILAFPCVRGGYCLHKVMVAGGCRGQGIATRLMRALLHALDRRRVNVFLTVDPANRPALQLYRTWGFTSGRLVRGFYRRQEDRLVLSRVAH
jgi:[ribosomal protein S18]-alanine N-acetyltransferase